MNWDLPWPTRDVQLYPHLHFTHQLEWLHNNQSECVIMTNMNGAIWTNQTAKFLTCIKWTNQEPEWAIVLYKQVIPFHLGVHFGFPLEAAFYLVCKLFAWIKFLLLPHPIFWTLVDIGLMAATFCWQESTTLKVML